MPTAPVPLLLLLLRHAALRQYVDTAMDLLGPAGAAQPAERFEPELVGLSAGLPRPTPWEILQRTLPGHGPVGTYLDGAKQDPTLPAFVDFWASLKRLAGYSAEALDFAIREVLDLAAYRFDAWVTSLAHFRLDSLRSANPNDGIVLGAYGWLEDVSPQAQRTPSAGYVHAPSLTLATTAAVLRSGYLTHRDGTQPAMAIDLTSDRVRLGLHLMDGVRSGQPLGALLGVSAGAITTRRRARPVHRHSARDRVAQWRACDRGGHNGIGRCDRRGRWARVAAQVSRRSEFLVDARTSAARIAAGGHSA